MGQLEICIFKATYLSAQPLSSTSCCRTESTSALAHRKSSCFKKPSIAQQSQTLRGLETQSELVCCHSLAVRYTGNVRKFAGGDHHNHWICPQFDSMHKPES